MSNPIIPRPCFVEHAALQLRVTHPRWAARVDKRIDRAIQLIKRGGVTIGDELLTYCVRSASDPNQTYRVKYSSHERTCTCPDYPTSHLCKHLLAVYLVIKASSLECVFAQARHYYQALANRNALAAKARAGVASERELAHLVFLHSAIEPLGRERFDLYRSVLDLAGLCTWRERVMRGDV